MKLVYSFGGGEARCYLEARVTSVTPSRMIVPTSGASPLVVPCLHLEYDLRSLLPISALLAAMVQQKKEPEVYVWDEHLAEPEVAILFRLSQPNKNVLDRISGAVGEPMNETLMQDGRGHVSTMAEVNLTQGDVKQFISDFDSVGQLCVVDVREVGVSRRFEEPPLQRFVTKLLNRGLPDFTLL